MINDLKFIYTKEKGEDFAIAKNSCYERPSYAYL